MVFRGNGNISIWSNTVLGGVFMYSVHLQEYVYFEFSFSLFVISNNAITTLTLWVAWMDFVPNTWCFYT